MPTQEQFAAAVKSGYTFKGENIKVGCAMLDGQVVPGADVYIPLKMLNRHGLIAGATGTGKTAAFSLPILERIDLSLNAVQALVLTPTRELAMQVTDAIRDLSGVSDGPVKLGSASGGSSAVSSLSRRSSVSSRSAGPTQTCLTRAVRPVGPSPPDSTGCLARSARG